jgi:hypothetical protein
MPRIDETASRPLKAVPTERELRAVYTPIQDCHLARKHTTGKPALVPLKTFHSLRSGNVSFLRPCSSAREKV